MPYLNVDLAYFTHRKTIRLVGLLGRGAEVLPIKLWSYCGMHHAESGRLTSYGPEEIETVAGWWGEKGRAVEALLTVGFLERDEGGNFQVHNWLEHAGHLAAFKKRAKSAAKERWARYASSIPRSKAKSKVKQSPSRGKARSSPVIPKSEEGECKGGDALTPETLVELYNKLTPDECPAVTTLSPGRRAKAKQYLTAFPKVEFWEQVFRRVHESKFLRGHANSNGHGSFRFDFDWMLTKGKDGSENAVKVFEGRYTDER